MWFKYIYLIRIIYKDLFYRLGKGIWSGFEMYLERMLGGSVQASLFVSACALFYVFVE